MIKIAVTGGLSSGKSTVCSFFKDLGAYVVCADEIVHRFLSPTHPIGEKVIEQLGVEIVNKGQLDRHKIADIVFSNPDKLKELEGIIHPAVFEEIEREYQRVKTQTNYRLFVAEIPLLYESKSKSHFDKVISVYSPLTLCKKRFRKRPLGKTEEFEKRMAHQMKDEEKAMISDYVLKNDGSLENLKKQTETLFSTLVEGAN